MSWSKIFERKTEIIITPIQKNKEKCTKQRYTKFMRCVGERILCKCIANKPKNWIETWTILYKSKKIDDKNKDRKKKIPRGILLLALSAYQLTAHYTHNTEKKKKEKNNRLWYTRNCSSAYRMSYPHFSFLIPFPDEENESREGKKKEFQIEKRRLSISIHANRITGAEKLYFAHLTLSSLLFWAFGNEYWLTEINSFGILNKR